MAYQKLQTSRALFTSTAEDSIIIPEPGKAYLTSRQTAAGTTTNIIDTTADFIKLGVKVGDVVVTSADGKRALVTGITSATELSVNPPITAGANVYSLYPPENQGCIVYINEIQAPATTGELCVITAGGDTVTYKGVTVGQFIPVQITHWKKLGSVNIVSIIANW